MPAEPPDIVKALLDDPRRKLGRYVLVSKLGKGGQSEVWKAWDTVLARDVAVKILKDADAEDVVRFRREANIVANLHHANIAPVFAMEQDGERYYIAMELVDGETIDALKAPLVKKLEHMRDAARALDFAHKKGIIHRDVKPSNIMVDGRGRLYLLDFGIARPSRRGATITATEFIVGTPAYMSPEQARGGRTDERGDVYALGATLYRLATHSDPFYGDDPMQVLLKVTQEPPPLPRTLEPSIPRPVEDIIRVAMSKEPEARHQSAAEFADEVDKFLAGKKVRAAPREPMKIPQGLLMASMAVIAVAAVGWALFSTLNRTSTEKPTPVVSTPGADPLAAIHSLDEPRSRIEHLYMNPAMSPEEREADVKAFRDAIEKTFKIAPNFGPANVEVAKLEWFLGRIKEADAAADLAVKHDPLNPTAWLTRARTRTRLALTARARRLASLQTSASPSIFEVNQLLKEAASDPAELRALFDGAIADLGQFRQLASSVQPAETAFAEGMAAFTTGRYGEAARGFQKATASMWLKRDANLMYALCVSVAGNANGDAEDAFDRCGGGDDVVETRLLLAMVQVLEAWRFGMTIDNPVVTAPIAYNLGQLRKQVKNIDDWAKVVPMSPFWKNTFTRLLNQAR